MRALTYYYSREQDPVDELQQGLKTLCDQYGLIFADECIDGDSLLEEKFSAKVPVVLVGPYHLSSNFTLSEVEVAIRSVIEKDQNTATEVNQQDRFKITWSERFAYWFSNAYIWVISLVLFLFVGLAVLAPVLAHQHRDRAADGIYRFYSILCHQLGYRSFYLFGEQAYYPRELAGITGVMSYETATGRDPEDLEFARNMIGNDSLGYKIALCQRDLSIYLSMVLFGIFFQLTGKKIRSLKWYLWFLIALLPIAIDGFSQLPGLAQGWPTWLIRRESTPFLRVLTGALFGAGTAWYMYPMLEESVKETRYQLKRKFNIVKRLSL